MPDRRYTYQVDIDVNQARAAARQLRGVFESELRSVNVQSTGASGGGGGVMGRALSGGGIGPNIPGLVSGALGVSVLGVGVGMAASRTLAFAKELDGLNRSAKMAEQGLLALVGSEAEVASRTALVQEAMGGTVSRIEAMQQATQLAALGFADTSAEMERFIRASQGASVATGRSTDYITQQLVLAISNQSLMRLDQLGLNASEVKQRIDELKIANADWTKEMLYQEAVLGRLEEKYGTLAGAAKDNASGIAQLSAAWTDYKTAISAAGGSVDSMAKALTGLISPSAEAFERYSAITALLKTTDPALRGVRIAAVELNNALMTGRITNDEYAVSLAGIAAQAERMTGLAALGPRRVHGDMGAGAGAGPVTPTMIVGGQEMSLGGFGEYLTYSRGSQAAADRAEREGRFEPGTDAYSSRLSQIMGQDSWEKTQLDKQAAEDAAREWESAADKAAAAWERAADDFESKLEAIPGLLGTSGVTEEQMNEAKLGVPQDFADNYLRRLTDEVLNGVNWEDVDLSEAAQLAGIDQSLGPEAQLAMFRKAWENSSLFANPDALRLINQDAVRSGLEQDRRGEEGRANILKLFGIEDDQQLADAGAAIGAGIRPGIVQGMSGAEGENGGAGIVASLGDQMNSDLGEKATRESFLGIGVNVVNIIRAGFGEQAAKADWLGAITSALMAQVAGLAGGDGFGGPALGDPSGVSEITP